MTQLKFCYRFLLIGVLLILTLLPRDVASAATGLLPAAVGYSLSQTDYVARGQRVPEVDKIAIEEDSFNTSISPTPPVPTLTAIPIFPTETAARTEPLPSNYSPSFSMIMGILFITAAAVLLVIAVKRGGE